MIVQGSRSNLGPGSEIRNEPITYYRPNQRHGMGSVEIWSHIVGSVWGARQLIWLLFKRDFFVTYKKSFLGISWMFLTPVINVIPWLFIWKVQIYDPGETDISFPVYILMGRSMWALFMGFFSGAASTLDSGRSLIREISYPHEAFLFKQTAAVVANYLPDLLMSVVIMLLFGLVPSIWIVMFPLAALPLFFLAAGLGLIVSLIRVVAYDLNRVISILMVSLMWTTPLLYSDKAPSPVLQSVIKWNPLTYLVCSCRDIILHGRFYQDNPAAYFIVSGLTLLLFLIAWRLFFVSEHKLIERLL